MDASGERSIAFHTGGAPFLGVASTGDYATIVHLPPGELRPPAQVDAPPGIDNLPFRVGRFVGRAGELERLDAALTAPGRGAVLVVDGLGGVGKSTLAAHWAATRSHGLTPVRWITADSPATVQRGLAKLATTLQPALDEVLTQEQLAERALQWLATHTGWLLILDNVNNLADIAPLLARASTGRVLITSRLTVWPAGTTVVRLDVLTPAESIGLLTRSATRTDPGRDMDRAEHLCEELGHLPLAVNQAGAYIAEADITPRAYLELLADYPADMYREEGSGELDEGGRTIARIWRITLERLTDTPLAGQVLRTIAWYAPDGIPRTLLAPLDNPPAVHRAVMRLAAYSMITVSCGTLRVHRLVQAVSRTPDPTDPHCTPDLIDQARQNATTALCIALPQTWETPDTWPVWRTLLPHIDALACHTDPATDTDTTAAVLNVAGRFLDEQGQNTRALEHLQRAVAGAVRVLGEDHLATLTARNNLAGAHESVGDLARAIPLYEQTLADMVRMLGEDHPATLTTRNNLASAYESAGDLARAIPLYEQTLTDRVRVLGEDHPHTLTTRNNLAYAYESVGDLARAVPLCEQTLADMVRVLGEDHPHTLTTRHNLAGWRGQAGDPAGAVAAYEAVLADRKRVLGEDHPDTLTTRFLLAEWRGKAGDAAGAVAAYEAVLADRKRVLGPDHPDTLTTRGNLAWWLREAGHRREAMDITAALLTDRARVLGENHPDTVRARNNLERWQAEAEDS
ncbi:tetratricopeptide repeat protein [Kitasatospora sp. NPDC058965]|uniref:tetratricopeptide repeat protein n=1 Tax=Kitasatospora sp. NPDC058965 TaxID=3346682 RepID=UPI003675EE86